MARLSFLKYTFQAARTSALATHDQISQAFTISPVTSASLPIPPSSSSHFQQACYYTPPAHGHLCSCLQVYIIRVTWSSGSTEAIYRRYSRFFDLQVRTWGLQGAAGRQGCIWTSFPLGLQSLDPHPQRMHSIHFPALETMSVCSPQQLICYKDVEKMSLAPV